MTPFSSDRYATMSYRRCGRSGLELPAISLGLWQNFGQHVPFSKIQQIARRAFDLGVTHFDLANNYGPPPGSAELNFGQLLCEDFLFHRDELIISTKAGYRMWDGPYGEWGSRKSLLASIDQSLTRLGVDYVDIFYSHRADPRTPLEETMAALNHVVRQGKALYVGISSYGTARTAEAARILKQLGTPCIIHQPSYSILNRWIERDHLLDQVEEDGIGCVAFSPLAQGMLTDKYLADVPAESRAATADAPLKPQMISAEVRAQLKSLNTIAQRRGQSLAQMSLAWALRDGRVTSALIGVSRVSQLEEAVAALDNLEFSDSELEEIDRHSNDADINLWAASSAV